MGLLDNFGEFVKTPEGQGLLSAAFGGMAGARKNQPWNTLGIAGLSGVNGFTSAIENQAQSQYRTAQTEQIARTAAAQKARQDAQARFRGSLSPDQQNTFDASPDEFIKTLPAFQKPQLVETADPKEPLRTQKMWLRPGETEGPIAGVGTMPEILDPRVQSAKQRIAAAGKSETNVFTGQKETFKNERDLRNDFAGLQSTKAFSEVQSAYDQIQTSLKSPSPAGDLAAATKIMKILDPGSVVRESELGMAMAATGMMDRAQNYSNMLLSGEKLTPAQRKDFGDLSTRLFDAASDRHNMKVNEYRGIAESYELNPDRIAKPSARQKTEEKQEGNAAGSRQFDVGGEKVIGTRGTDGNYYVTKGGKKYRVEE